MAKFRNWKTTKKPLPDIDPSAVPAHLKADGWVSIDEKFMCECGSVMANDSHCISSHLTKVHNPDSAYQKTQYKRDGKTWACPDCESRHPNWNSLLAHRRRDPHGFRGDSSNMREKYDPYKPGSTLEEAFLSRARLANQTH
ncbi:hypothetical protein F4805DRAFT_472878 [Annulohypoxylon moriforme]|nr:hypothetical protein F4805DRAFT_472878 [Annulohypoxylon moriforme]